MQKNIKDSILFLTSARIALCETIKSSNHSENLKNKIMNEMTDYEILHLIMRGKTSKRKYNFADELSLFESFRDIVKENLDIISTCIGKNEAINITEISSISPYGLSSQRIVIEHLQNYRINLNKNEETFWGNFVNERKSILDFVPDTPEGHTGTILTAIAAATVIGTAAVKIYQRFFSQAAKSCYGLKGEDKTQCMNKYKIRALQAQITQLKKGAALCKKSKSPNQCNLILKNKISNIQNKIHKLG